MTPVCLGDFEVRARTLLPKPTWDFIAGGSGAELTMRSNRAAFDAVRVVPRVLRGAALPDPAGRLCGTPAKMPVAVAPMAYQRLVHPDGELAVARAAREAGVPMAVAMLSSVPIEQISAVGATLWFQLYWLRDRGLMEELVGRAEAAGCRALTVTVDVMRMGRRLRDIRNGFALPPHVAAAHLADGAAAASVHADERSAVAVHVSLTFDPTLSWRDLAWLRERTRLPLILKGILDHRDAAMAAEMGVDAIVVSNHGGRQFDGAVAAIDALPAVCAAVAGRCEVLLDSGVRGGIDVLKALTLGADGVLLGRPVLWGLVDGEDGVTRVLSLLREELIDAMTQVGCHDLPSIRDLAHWRQEAPAEHDNESYADGLWSTAPRPTTASRSFSSTSSSGSDGHS